MPAKSRHLVRQVPKPTQLEWDMGAQHAYCYDGLSEAVVRWHLKESFRKKGALEIVTEEWRNEWQ